MRRTIRILGHGATVVSLLLCVASGVLWVRSYRVIDQMTWLPADGSDRGYGYETGLGVFSFERLVTSRRIGADQREYSSVPVTARKKDSHRRWIEEESWHGFAWQTIEFSNSGANLFGYRQYISVPYWFIVLCTALLPSALIYRRFRQRMTRRGRCARCGYDLRATPDRCPECGTIPVTAAPAAPPDGP